MSKNHTSKQETVGEAIRDIAHHEHNFALADNSTNHIGDLVVYGTLYLLAILFYVIWFDWLFVLLAVVAIISVIRYQNFLRHKVDSQKMTLYFVNTSLISTGVRSFVIGNAPLLALSMHTQGKFNLSISLLVGLITALIGITCQYHYLTNHQVIDRQKESPNKTCKNAVDFSIKFCKKGYVNQGFFFDIACGFALLANHFSYKEFILVKFEAWQFVLITILIVLGTVLFQRFLHNKVVTNNISKGFKWGTLLMTAARGYLIAIVPWVAVCLFKGNSINWLAANLLGALVAIVGTGLQYKYLHKVRVF
ncbi:hypothetical protein JF76_11140 [Lactobacillus kullabergensis]|uniref:Uncharacterized protein n=1 Tax=Lactobacillus kullabergensis TaxID=1218493 RepID=A0A0F4LD68_9LACO|nr:hypothetical protein [Lactobacillus kullabergensis]KJY55471.1 hypothetical protein JF76_11140 [Lactobacillus kullabergensis]